MQRITVIGSTVDTHLDLAEVFELHADGETRPRRGEVEQQGTIASAITVPYRAIRSRDTLRQVIELVVTICNGGNRNGLAVSLQERLGLRVMNLDGGTGAWEEAGYPLLRPAVAAG